MKTPLILLAIAFTSAGAAFLPATALASSAVEFDAGNATSAAELQPYLQCVPYARQLSGIQIYGDAHSWWDQAAGRYQRGQQPRVGAVMAFQPYQGMVLGHVAAVSKIIDSRTVLLSHSNWSPINGRRGQIENNVQAVDVSPGNDWSQVRVWYAPMQALGTTAWPVHGFIYGERGKGAAPAMLAPVRIAKAENPAPILRKSSRAFLSAFADLDAEVGPERAKSRSRSTMQAAAASQRSAAKRAAAEPVGAKTIRADHVRAAIALYEG